MNGEVATAEGLSNVHVHEALECCLRYADAGVVPTGHTKVELDSIYAYRRMMVARQSKREREARSRKEEK